MGDWFASATISGSLLIAIPVAILAGLVSFFSPCVIPLLPGYLSYATGLSGVDAGTASRARVLAGTALFVAGFGAVFISFGTLFGAIGYQLLAYQRPMNIVLGFITIALGLVFMGHLRWAQREVRIHAAPRVGLLAGPVLGGTFALGWTPCLGPTLTAVLALSSTEATAGRGALLALAYSLGLGVPFLIAGALSDRAMGASAWARRHRRTINLLGGAMLVAVGIALATGLWETFVFGVRSWVSGYQIGI
ncbi:cytochrome c biogenesis CcdA family protein [Solicola sp. PLA-1-18]|uniref:cytochrome c biogenesis CcdA family protein n=1 Tax=Solicola sp. PLA-1-18 TaxID=3380532 RepID=UPI003B7AFD31